MSNLDFTKPVMVFVGSDFLRQIGSITEADEYLTEWPQRRRGPIFETARRACEAAKSGTVTAEQAYRAFEGFCRVSGVLAPAVEAPSRQAARQPSAGYAA